MLAKDLKLTDINKFPTVRVGDLKKLFEKYNISNNVVVLTQRIEDVYFEKHGWETLKIESGIYKGEFDEYIPTHAAYYSEELKVIIIDCHY